ncbi:hypothetical protein MKX03_003815 [Papaver bracteatum]|nr:hypothetical protein MKX03_003815 [Papaver bracteatum]
MLFSQMFLKQAKQVQRLISLVHLVTKENGGQPYTNEIFDEIKKGNTKVPETEHSEGPSTSEEEYSGVLDRITEMGVIGIKVNNMLDWDPKGKNGPMTPFPDVVTIHQPKVEEYFVSPSMMAPTEIEMEVPPQMIVA